MRQFATTLRRMQRLNNFGTISFTGADVRNFLQGQLSNDLQLLTPQQSLLNSCNSAQGRVQVVLTLIERSDAIVAVLPASMIDTTMARLRKYILRSKVVITATHNTLHCNAATAHDLQSATLPIPTTLGAHLQQHASSILRWPDANAERYMVLQTTIETNTAATDDDHQWLLADIRAGLPQVLPPTHEAFVAQMLNLDLISGISFNKGCYTGQEIIARAHFRGAVKRRLFRMRAACPPPAPATRILLQADQATHAGDVVMAAATDNGCELLAVLSLNQQGAPLCLETHPMNLLEQLSLPYEPVGAAILQN